MFIPHTMNDWSIHIQIDIYLKLKNEVVAIIIWIFWQWTFEKCFENDTMSILCQIVFEIDIDFSFNLPINMQEYPQSIYL